MICLVNADALRLPLSDESVHMVVTSPPYFDLRVYSSDERELGREVCVKDYVDNLACAFDEVRRVLRSDGTCWVNIADSYNGSGGAGGDYNKGGLRSGQPRYPGHRDPALKDKDMCLVPEHFVIAMQEHGWYVRSEVIWRKTNGMPGSATDRPATTHEKLYLFSKSKKYFYDQDAVRSASGSALRSVWSFATSSYKGGGHYAKFPVSLVEPCIKLGTSRIGVCPICHSPIRRVVSRSTQVYNPQEAERRIRATGGAISGGTARSTLGVTQHVHRITTGWEPTCKCVNIHELAEDGPAAAVVLDPFCGSGTTGVVCKALGRSFVGCDLSYAYLHNDARPRLRLDKELPI